MDSICRVGYPQKAAALHGANVGMDAQRYIIGGCLPTPCKAAFFIFGDTK